MGTGYVGSARLESPSIDAMRLTGHSMSFGDPDQQQAPDVGEDAAAVLAALPARERQFVLTMATVGAAHDVRLRRHLAKATRVSHAGVLPPTLQQRFHLIAKGGKPAYLVGLLRDAAADEWLSDGEAIASCE